MSALIRGLNVLLLATVLQQAAWAADVPQLTVTEVELGTWDFLGDPPPIQLDIQPGEPLDFSWVGDASAYGGSIQDYRYGYNIVDPDIDDNWDQNWCSTCLSGPTRSFSSGVQLLRIEVRDVLGATTRSAIVLTVRPVAVDDRTWSVIKRLYRE